MSDDNQAWVVGPGDAGQTLAGFVRERLSLPWSQVRRLIATGKVSIDERVCVRDSERVGAGQAVSLRMNAPRPRPADSGLRIAYEDSHVVVIDKPAGVSSVPYEPRETGTAMDLLRQTWRRTHPDATRVPLHVVHRIDKATSGLLVFAKSKRAELGLAAQLRTHSMERRYLCVAHGAVTSTTIESRLVRDRGDGLRGSARHPGQGKRAVTHVTCLKPLAGASLCEVRLETGKTHQIRIHLSERGHPLVGERVYVRDYLARGQQPIDAPRLLLHAATLGFEHPISGAPISLAADPPADFVAVLARLRGDTQPESGRGQRGARGPDDEDTRSREPEPRAPRRPRRDRGAPRRSSSRRASPGRGRRRS
ncbi:MAG: RluA family pseudouridine synthase [Haliangiales bacterium]